MGMLGAPFRRFSELTFVLLIWIVFLDNGSLIDDRRLPLFCSASTCFCCCWSVAIDEITILLVIVPTLVPVAAKLGINLVSLLKGHQRILGRIVRHERLLRANGAEVNCGRGTDIGVDRSARFAIRELVGHAVAGEERGLVIDVQMQMRLRRAAGIADMTDDLADTNPVPDLHLHGAGAHVRIEDVSRL